MINCMKAVATFLCLSGAALADPLVGTWQTEPDEGAFAHIEIAPCGENFCGTIARTFKDGTEYTSPNKGKTLVIDMTAQGGGKYRGKVWRPSNDKFYTGKIALNGNDMKLSGCVAGGLLCSKQSWVRVN